MPDQPAPRPVIDLDVLAAFIQARLEGEPDDLRLPLTSLVDEMWLLLQSGASALPGWLLWQGAHARIIRQVASIWRAHPDYLTEWAPH